MYLEEDMGKILDLNVFKVHTLDITLLDGSTIHLPKPTQRTAIEITAFEATTKPNAKNLAASLETVSAMVLRILNSNLEHRPFAAEDLAEYTVEMLLAITQAYSAFLIEVQSDPN